MINHQPCHIANLGFGISPNRHCLVCKGRGFVYVDGWAESCATCKQR